MTYAAREASLRDGAPVESCGAAKILYRLFEKFRRVAELSQSGIMRVAEKPANASRRVAMVYVKAFAFLRRLSADSTDAALLSEKFIVSLYADAELFAVMIFGEIGFTVFRLFPALLCGALERGGAAFRSGVFAPMPFFSSGANFGAVIFHPVTNRGAIFTLTRKAVVFTFVDVKVAMRLRLFALVAPFHA